jgi:hypothetical protein
MFCGGRGKIGGLVEKSKGPWVGIDVMIFFYEMFFGGREDEDKRRQEKTKILSNSILFQNCHFWAYVKK